MEATTTNTNTPPSSKQKAGLLLKMANAVEDSSARRRQQLIQHHIIDADSVSQLITDLEVVGNHPTNTSAASASIKRLQPPPSRHQSQPVDHYQVQLLFSAMISYRANADLKYQLLELQHLDLKQSFVELEGRYRRLETEQEVWKQSCQALQQAGSNAVGTTTIHVDGTASTAAVPTSSTTNNAFATSTVPILQQELRSLCSQRNQLLQANLELRKQLKQIQIQRHPARHNNSTSRARRQVAGAATATTCQHCHAELFESLQQRPVDQAIDQLVEHFQSSTTSMASEHNNNNNNNNNSAANKTKYQGEEKESQTEEEEEEDHDNNVNQDDDESFLDRSTIRQHREENQHLDRMNLLGMQLSSTRPQQQQQQQQLATNDVSNNNHNRRPLVAAIEQKSIVWSPPPSSHQRTARAVSPTPSPPLNSSSNNKLRVNNIMTPTLNSFMPMQHSPTKKNPPQHQHQHKLQRQQDIQVSARNVTPPGGKATASTRSTTTTSQYDDIQFDATMSGGISFVPPQMVTPSHQSHQNHHGQEEFVNISRGMIISSSNASAAASAASTPKEIQVTQPPQTQIPAIRTRATQEFHVTPPPNHHGSIAAVAAAGKNRLQQRMDRFGKLDEIGRAISGHSFHIAASNHSALTTSTTNSTNTMTAITNTCGSITGTNAGSKAMNLFRRRSGAPQQPQPQHQQAAQRHSTMAASTAAAHNGHVEYTMPGHAAANATPIIANKHGTATSRHSVAGSSHHSLGGGDSTITSRHLEFHADGSNLNDHGSMASAARRGGGGRRGEEGSQSGLRRQLSHDNKVPMPPPTTRSHVTGGSRKAAPSHPVHAGSSTTSNHSRRSSSSRGQATGTGGREAPAVNVQEQCFMRSSTVTTHHHPQQQRPQNHSARARSNEQKPARPQSYFERIKKTLQQEM